MSRLYMVIFLNVTTFIMAGTVMGQYTALENSIGPMQRSIFELRHKITLRAGIDYPLDEFRNGTVSSEGILGFASSGFYSGFAFDMEITHFIYLSLSINYTNNPVNIYELQAALETDLPGSIADISTSDWNNFSVMFGLSAGSVEGRFDYLLKAQTGIVSMYSPEYEAYNITGSQRARIRQGSQISVSFGFILSGDLSYRILPWLGISAGLNYQLTNASFKRVMYTNSNGFGKRVNIDLNASSISVFGGLRFYLK